MTKIIIDPLTRIEGHLKVEVNVENNRVNFAQVSGTMARGLESLMLNRDPRDAPYITERICGVCFTAHGWTSSMAVEKAHGTQNLPKAARLIRNLIAGGAWLHDHILHFYHLSATDYLDMTVLKDYSGTDAYLIKIRELIKKEANNLTYNGQYAGPFLPTYKADEYCINDIEIVVRLVQNYLKALKIQAKAKKMSAIFGGKQPHQSGIVPGGVTQIPEQEQLNAYTQLLNEIKVFIDECYIPDVKYLASGPLKDLAKTDIGVGYSNYLSFGGFEQADGTFLFPTGAILGETLISNDRTELENSIYEDISKSWYTSDSGGHPSDSLQNFHNDKNDAYSFVKAPRFNGEPMEVGPLARLMVAMKTQNHKITTHPDFLDFKNFIENGNMPGVVARHFARAIETKILIDELEVWVLELDALISAGNIIIHDSAHWTPPNLGTGWGLNEAPRGALGHWIKISNQKIDHYSCVVPTTWNASPTDTNNKPGPCEEALLNCVVNDEANPINIGRIIRSFDPCLACAVHLIQPEGKIEKFGIGCSVL